MKLRFKSRGLRWHLKINKNTSLRVSYHDVRQSFLTYFGELPTIPKFLNNKHFKNWFYFLHDILGYVDPAAFYDVADLRFWAEIL
jgi:hypothetical protein